MSGSKASRISSFTLPSARRFSGCWPSTEAVPVTEMSVNGPAMCALRIEIRERSSDADDRTGVVQFEIDAGLASGGRGGRVRFQFRDLEIPAKIAGAVEGTGKADVAFRGAVEGAGS